MRRLQIVLLTVILSLFSIAPVYAHGGGEATDVSAQGLVKQAIAFLEGIQDDETARMDIQKAIQVADSDVDQNKLNQALNLLQQPDRTKIDQAKVLLAEALGKDPQNAVELAFRPGYKSSPLNTVLLVLAAAFAVLGAIIVSKVKASH